MMQSCLDLTRREALGRLSLGAGGASALALLPACATGAPLAKMPAASNAADAALERIAYAMLAHEPGRATGLGVDVGEYAHWRGTFGTPGEAGISDYAATLKRLLAEARSYPREALTPDQVTGFEVVESAFAKALEGMALPYGDVAVGSWRNAPYNVIQNVGGYIDYPRFFGSTQPLREADDVVHYVARVSELPKILAAETDRLKFNRGMGLVPPDFLLDKTIAQMEAAIRGAEESYAGPLEASEFGGNDMALRAVKTIIAQGIQPTLAAQLEEIKAQRAIANSHAGMWAQPRGDEYYAWAVSASTTTALTPDEIHEQGLEELAELHGQMDVILKELGYTQGSVGARMRALAEDPAYKFSPGDEGRAEIIAFIEDRIAWITAQMPRAFTQLVNPPLEVRRLPLAEELGAPGAYGGAGSKDGSIPGRMWINLRTTDLHRKYDLADLTFHESIPGHVWEGEFSNRLPLIRSILAFNAFSEGWALYAEQLADELGAYDDFKVGRLGYLQSLAFRACRLVVDTGLHHKRWTREQGRRFFVEENGSKVDEVASEVDRYCSWPGQACGYKIGHTEIVAQRARAQSELGARYDLRAFNTAVVLGGNAPLDVMANTVSRYIAQAKG
ncbi:MAG: twin-arginine translocation pathway signal [Erythrobacter sp. SCN 62-14]|nr:MAG: twin-arginine translocation pathway signal [Erythrobacter sp. SCN 62-14]